MWCLLRERRCPRCCKICPEEAPDKQDLRSWNENEDDDEDGEVKDGDDGKHEDKDGVCKDLE